MSIEIRCLRCEWSITATDLDTAILADQEHQRTTHGSAA